MNSVFAQNQAAIVTRLEGDPWLASLKEGIIRQDTGDIESAIETKLASLGVLILVLHAAGNVANPNVPGPFFNEVRFGVQIAENVTINRNGRFDDKTGPMILERVLARLHHFQLGGGATLVAQGFQLIEPPHNATFAYQANFTASEGIVLSL